MNCSDVNFQEENEICDFAAQLMEEDYKLTDSVYVQEEKECIDEYNNIVKYIHCEKILVEPPSQA